MHHTATRSISFLQKAGNITTQYFLLCYHESCCTKRIVLDLNNINIAAVMVAVIVLEKVVKTIGAGIVVYHSQ